MRKCLLVCLLCGLCMRILARENAACTESGTLTNATYPSTLTDQTLDYAIYLPPCYAAQTTPLPVIYLFHGSNSNHTHWAQLGIEQVLNEGIRLGSLPPLVVVMPYGGWMANENRFDSQSWENVFLTETLPAIEATYNVATDGDQRAIGGISRGGFWAYLIALRHPQMFFRVGGHSAFFDPQNAPPAFNPLDLVQTELLRAGMWLDRGVDDYAQYGLDLLADTLRQDGFTPTYTIYPTGEHNDAYWASHLREYLWFYTNGWTNPMEYSLTDAAQAMQPASFVPVVAFNSPLTEVDAKKLEALLGLGGTDYTLVLTPRLRDLLRASGQAYLNPRTMLVEEEALLPTLQAGTTLITLLPIAELTPEVRVLDYRASDGVARPILAAAYGSAPFYPLALAADWDAQRATLTRFTFTGVTALARNVIPVLDARGVDWAVSGIRDVALASDFFHMSNEVSFAPRCPQSDEPVLGGLCSKDAHFSVFTALGVDIIELTGNHNNDYNFAPYLRTLAMFQAADMQTVGGGATLADARQPLILTHHGNTIGVLACNWNGPDLALATDTTPGATYCDRDWLAQAIPALKAQVDVLIVSIQYAEYERTTPIDRQKNDFRFIADLGADVVLGSQAHRPQTFERYLSTDGRMVMLHYGLGNLFFDQMDLPNRQFFMDTLLIRDGQFIGMTLFPGIIEDQARPRRMTATEAAALMTEVMQ